MKDLEVKFHFFGARFRGLTIRFPNGKTSHFSNSLSDLNLARNAILAFYQKAGTPSKAVILVQHIKSVSR